MGLSYIAMAVHPHGPKLRLKTTCTEIDLIMAEDRTGPDGEASSMMYPPDFFASDRFIGHSPLRSGRDHLRFPALLQHQRRAERFLQFPRASQRRALRFPERLARVFVQRRYVLCIPSIADKKEPVPPEYRRTAGADLVIQFQLL